MIRILHFADLHLAGGELQPGHVSCSRAIIALVGVRDGIHCHRQEGT